MNVLHMRSEFEISENVNNEKRSGYAHNDSHALRLLRLMSQGYIALILEKKFCDRYQDLIEKYQRSVMVNDSFPG